MTSMITETIGNEYNGIMKWYGIVKGRDDCLYCLPHGVQQLLKIDPSNDETTLVGEVYYGSGNWCDGFAHGDFIYGIPYHANKFLKYNLKTGISELVGDDLGNGFEKWISGAVADDGCLYCFPYSHNRILKFNPNDDTTIFVGEEFEEIEGDDKFSGTIKAKNGCIYGIPSCARRVAKFNVASQNVTFIGDEYEGNYKWMGSVKGMDDNIYGIPSRHDKWLKINIATETTSLFGDDLSKGGDYEYSGGVIGEDCNVYTIPACTNKVPKFSTITQEMSEVGNLYDEDEDKWSGGVIHSNGYIYTVHHTAIIKY